MSNDHDEDSNSGHSSELGSFSRESSVPDEMDAEAHADGPTLSFSRRRLRADGIIIEHELRIPVGHLSGQETAQVCLEVLRNDFA